MAVIIRILKKVLLFPLDLLFLTVDSWIVGGRYLVRLIRREKDQRCHFCKGEDTSEANHPVRSVLKYQNIWLVRLLSPCLRVRSESPKRVVVCSREGGYTKASPLAPVLALGMTFSWGGLLTILLSGAAYEPDHVLSNFVTFFNPARTLGARQDDPNFLEAVEGRLNPERAERYYLAGIRHFDRQDFVRAQVDFKIAIQSNPGDANLHYHLARSLFAVGQFVQGEASVRQTLQLDPDHPDALLMMAELQERREDRAGALQNASRSLAQRPDHLQSLRMVLALTASLGQLEEAREYADRLMALDSESPSTLAFLSRVELNAFRNLETARGLLTTALEKDPDHIDSLLGMIPIHAQDQNTEGIDDTIARVLEINPNHLDANRLRVEMLMSRYGLGVGLREYQELLGRFAGDLNLRLRYAELLIQAGRMSEGLRMARQLTASRVPAVERSAHWLLAQSFAQLRMLEEAAEHGRQALSTAPNNRNMLLFLAQVQMQTNNLLDARRNLERVVAQNPEDGQAITLLAQCLVLLEDTPEALRMLSGILEQNPEADLIRLRRVEIMMQSDRWRDSLADARYLQGKYPDRPEFSNNLAFILARSGQELDLAYSLIAPLREQFSDNPLILGTYAFVIAARGDDEAAVPLYQSALERASANPSIRFHLGQSLARLGRLDEARQHLQSVLILEPRFPQANEVRALLTQLGGGAS